MTVVDKAKKFKNTVDEYEHILQYMLEQNEEKRQRLKTAYEELNQCEEELKTSQSLSRQIDADSKRYQEVYYQACGGTQNDMAELNATQEAIKGTSREFKQLQQQTQEANQLVD